MYSWPNIICIYEYIHSGICTCFRKLKALMITNFFYRTNNHRVSDVFFVTQKQYHKELKSCCVDTIHNEMAMESWREQYNVDICKQNTTTRIYHEILHILCALFKASVAQIQVECIGSVVLKRDQINLEPRSVWLVWPWAHRRCDEDP